MYSDPHVQLVELDHAADLRDGLDHADAELHHIIGLFSRPLPVALVEEAHHDVTVSDGVELEEVEPVALFVEVGEEPGQHLDDLSPRFAGRVGGVAADVCEQYGHVVVGFAPVVEHGAVLQLR